MFNKLVLLAILFTLAISQVSAVDRFYGRKYDATTVCSASANNTFLSYTGGRCADFGTKSYIYRNCSSNSSGTFYIVDSWFGGGCTGVQEAYGKSYKTSTCLVDGANSYLISSCLMSAGSVSFAVAAVIMAILATLI